MNDDMQKAELTDDEAKQFTIINIVAFDIARKRARDKDGSILPCWLCMSEDARSRYIQDILAFVDGQLGRLFVPADEATAYLVSRGITQEMVDGWRDMEAHYKYLRDVEKNPRAFFAD